MHALLYILTLVFAICKSFRNWIKLQLGDKISEYQKAAAMYLSKFKQGIYCNPIMLVYARSTILVVDAIAALCQNLKLDGKLALMPWDWKRKRQMSTLRTTPTEWLPIHSLNHSIMHPPPIPLNHALWDIPSTPCQHTHTHTHTYNTEWTLYIFIHFFSRRKNDWIYFE